jgi:RNA polymerase sigma-70 factor (ECF subfamily)
MSSPEHCRTLQLFDAARRGDRRAVEDLFARYLPRVRRIVSLRMGRKLLGFTEHEDLAQETLLRVFRGLEQFEANSEGSLRYWISQCVERAIADCARRLVAKKRGEGNVVRFGDRGTEAPLSSIFAGKGPTPSSVAASREREERIEEALLALPPHHREIINLRFFCEMSFSEIADTLKIGSEATARKALFRAVGKLKERLGEEFETA